MQTDIKENSIDVIIPFVNGDDKFWLKDFTKATGTYSPSKIRFRSWGTLRYLFRGVHKYMPFVRNVILIVSRESQVPIWINRDNVRIVYHKDFIPKQFLPTFNSCTIESFLYRIPDLSDKIIYFNDDMFPISNLSEDDFFDGDIPRLRFTDNLSINANNIFRNQCRSGMNLITSILHLPRYEEGKLILPEHTVTPMLKSTLDYIGELGKIGINNSISMLRRNSNVNQYIYSYYHYFTNNYAEGKGNFRYFDINSDLDDLKSDFNIGYYQIVCINDSSADINYKNVRDRIIALFEKKFPEKCKYEI